MEMNLVMPNNDVELEQEEMMYVDEGGFDRQWFNTVGFVGEVIDVAMIVTGNSIGGLIASGIDIVEGKRNGIVFG